MSHQDLRETLSPLKDVNDSHEVRSLRWKVKQLGKQIGKASATIYALRNENAALREAVTWTPGDRARLYSEVREQAVEIRRLESVVANLLKIRTDAAIAERARRITNITVESDESVTL